MTRAAGGASDQLEPVFIKFLRVKLNGCRDAEHGRLFTKVGIQSQTTASASDHKTDITIGQPIGTDGVTDDVADFLLGPWHLQENRAS